jgi:hypothetical protein
LPKLYYPTPDELQGATPLHERSWFVSYQNLLVRLTNTAYGRDLLCIDSWEKQPYRVVRVTKNMVTFYLGQWGGRYHWRSDVRVGAKWGNVIRFRWLEVKKALDRMNLEVLLALPQYTVHAGKVLAVPRGASHTIFYPDPSPESTSVDGNFGHTQASTAWSTVRGGAGTNAFDSADDDNMALFKSSTTTNGWTSITRAAFLFDTSGIGDTDSLDNATMSLRGTSIRDDGVDTPIDLNIYTSAPASNVALVAGDFNSLGGTDLSTKIQDSSWNTTGYNDFLLNASGEAAVDFTGISKFGTRDETSDAGNSAPAWESDKASAMLGNFADKTGTTDDPKLVINHTASAFQGRRAMVF